MRLTKLVLCFIKFIMVVVLAENNADQEQSSSELFDLTEFLAEFEEECEKSGMALNTTQMEMEIEACLRTEMKESPQTLHLNGNLVGIQQILNNMTSDSSESLNLIRSNHQRIVEGICTYVPALMNCVKPQLLNVEPCLGYSQSEIAIEDKLIEYSEVFVESACVDNGGKLHEFLESGGLACAQLYFAHALECIKDFSGKFINSEGEIVPQTTAEVCGNLEGISKCIYKCLDVCMVQTGTPIIRSMLDQVQSWTTSQKCLSSSGTIHTETIAVTLTIFLFSLCQ